jgi:hypothetical protein
MNGAVSNGASVDPPSEPLKYSPYFGRLVQNGTDCPAIEHLQSEELHARYVSPVQLATVRVSQRLVKVNPRLDVAEYLNL